MYVCMSVFLCMHVLCICMYVCMYVCSMYVCTYVCMCVCKVYQPYWTVLRLTKVLTFLCFGVWVQFTASLLTRTLTHNAQLRKYVSLLCIEYKCYYSQSYVCQNVFMHVSFTYAVRTILQFHWCILVSRSQPIFSVTVRISPLPMRVKHKQ